MIRMVKRFSIITRNTNRKTAGNFDRIDRLQKYNESNISAVIEVAARPVAVSVREEPNSNTTAAHKRCLYIVDDQGCRGIRERVVEKSNLVGSNANRGSALDNEIIVENRSQVQVFHSAGMISKAVVDRLTIDGNRKRERQDGEECRSSRGHGEFPGGW